MTAPSQLGSTDLLDALDQVVAVLSDNAAALDRLQRGDAWIEGDDQADLVEDPDDGADSSSGSPTSNREADGQLLAGSDLAATMAAAVGAGRQVTGLPDVAAALHRGAVDGSSGPAGRDVAAILDGLAEGLRNADRLDAQRFAIGLEIGAERLTPADDGSHAGCVPAVVAGAANGALSAVDRGADLADTVIAAADEGLVELEAGPTSNPDLVERGVVDAAAAGFLLMLDALASVLTGEPLPSPPEEVPHGRTDGRRYEVRCRVEPHPGCGLESANWLESTWFELGDLSEFDGLGSTWRAAVVTSMPGAAVEALFEVGRPRDLHIGLAQTDT